MRKEQRDDTALDYFSVLSGAIRRLPTGEQTAISEILAYLEDCHFVVYPAPRGEGVPKFVYQGAVVTLQMLVSIANEHRAVRRLPPFPPIRPAH